MATQDQIESMARHVTMDCSTMSNVYKSVVSGSITAAQMNHNFMSEVVFSEDERNEVIALVISLLEMCRDNRE